MTNTASDWFRNKSWNAEIEAAFFAKLKRARDKTQYLRIQSSYLVESCPRESLMLLDKYFELGGGFDTSQAHFQRAQAFAKLNQIDEAIGAGQEAVDCELAKPNSISGVGMWLPLFIAKQRKRTLYEYALQVADRYKKYAMFPSQIFDHYAAIALIHNDGGSRLKAQNAAVLALAAAEKTESPFPRHKFVGLVEKSEESLILRMREIAAVPL